ncbi:MAG TPA: DinB family protein [Phycisphaerae bacterium]|nr:DinB family protein [Phycisphaerae bacterium]
MPSVPDHVSLLEEAFSKKSWHGTNLRGSIRGMTAKEAAWRPGPQRKCVWDHVLHTAYWKYTVRRRLTGEKRGSFPLKGSNWFDVPRPSSKMAWREHVILLEHQHAQLRDAVAGLSERQLNERVSGSKLTKGYLIRGIALHDIYHTGQIQLLKRMRSEAGV